MLGTTAKGAATVKMTRRLGILAVSVMALLPIAGTWAQEASPEAVQGKHGQVVIGYSAPGLVGAQLEIEQGLVDHAKAKGWKVLTTTSNNDPQKQLDDINSYITQDVDAIVAVPDDSAAICTAVQAAKDANIPFYTIDRSPEGCSINMTVLSDNYLAGKQSAEELVKLLTERYGSPKGTVLEITGELSQNVAQLRGAGFDDVMKKQPDIHLIVKTAEKWDSAKAADIVRDVASSEDTIDAIYMHSDSAYTAGTIQVLQEIGKLVPRGEDGHVFLAGVDGSPDALQAIRDGNSDQSSNQPIPDFGLIVNWIEQGLRGEEIKPGPVTEANAMWSPAEVKASDVGPQLFLATTSVTPANVDDPRLWANILATHSATPTS
jgi:ABC-type sugar transport system substrate-binding protein